MELCIILVVSNKYTLQYSGGGDIVLNLPPINPHSYQPLREQVYDLVREAILTGMLPPGEQITEVSIADQLKVSRTPTREAIRMLEQEGLIVIIPRKGAFVTGIKSMKEINDIFQVRVVLEGLAASLAAENITVKQLEKLNQQTELITSCLANADIKGCIEIDTAFHRLICEASANDMLQKILDNLFEQITRFRGASLGSAGRLKEALDEHIALAQAITDREPEKAQELAIAHLENAKNCVLAVFQQQNRPK